MRILVADDHAVVRHGLKQILTEAFPSAVCDEAASGEQTLALVQANSPSVVVLDMSLPDQSGLEVLRSIHRTHPRLPVIVLSAHPEEQFAVRTLKAGASGYLNKESAPEELVKAIRVALRGGRYVSPRLAEKLAFDLQVASGRPVHETLSDREYQVMLMIAGGISLKEIANRLSVSIKTVSTYRARVLEKLHVKSNAELVRYALQNRLIA